MARARILRIDPPRRWPRAGVVVAALAAGALLGVAVSQEEPHEAARPAPAAAAAPVLAPPVVPVPPLAAGRTTAIDTLDAPAVVPAAAVARAPLSTEIAPGVHVTPLAVPPGTLPQPAAPGPQDTESEN
ncbi:MAG: hypothetical protein KF788_05530 [Piscinibacter sp.]|nr:hypothetical protein [Piscinibacter sp.]